MQHNIQGSSSPGLQGSGFIGVSLHAQINLYFEARSDELFRLGRKLLSFFLPLKEFWEFKGTTMTIFFYNFIKQFISLEFMSMTTPVFLLKEHFVLAILKPATQDTVPLTNCSHLAWLTSRGLACPIAWNQLPYGWSHPCAPIYSPAVCQSSAFVWNPGEMWPHGKVCCICAVFSGTEEVCWWWGRLLLSLGVCSVSCVLCI